MNSERAKGETRVMLERWLLEKGWEKAADPQAPKNAYASYIWYVVPISSQPPGGRRPAGSLIEAITSQMRFEDDAS